MPEPDFIEGTTERLQRSPRALRAPAEEGGAISPSNALRVLIVEDEYFVALEIENWLLDAGHQVVGTASSADEAVALAAAHRPDFMFMDIRLVGRRDGVDAATEIFNRFGIRSLFASAHADPATQARAAPAQPLGWLTKPFLERDVIRAIAAVIQTLAAGSGGRS